MLFNMRISRSLATDLLQNTPSAPPESGGILGAKDGIVTDYFADKGLPDKTGYGTYAPNTTLLNEIIGNWAKDDIDFCGLYHTHLPGGISLSDADKEYIREILIAAKKDKLFFPILLDNQMIVYCAYWIKNRLCTERVDAELI